MHIKPINTKQNLKLNIDMLNQVKKKLILISTIINLYLYPPKNV